MRLRCAEAAVFDLDKLERYCLDPRHPRGRHKARVFRQSLGLERADAAWLKSALLQGAQTGDAVLIASDDFGERFRIDIPLTRQERRAVVRTIWIVRTDEDFARFVTCWVL
jgi:hypothetical protein